MIDYRSHRARLGRLALGAMLALSLAACGSGAETKPDAASTSPSDTPSVPAPTPPADSDTPVTTNNIPVLDGVPALAVQAGDEYTFTPSVTDDDNDTLTFSIKGKPDWATFDAMNGSLSGTPGDADVGQTADIEIMASDGTAETSISFKIKINPRNPPPSTTPNHPPTLSGTPSNLAMATQSYIFVPTATDEDNDSLSFSITNRPKWATFNTSTGELLGTPARTDTGTYSNIRITVSDGKASTSLPAFRIDVQPAPNSAPTISGSPSTSVQAGSTYSFTPSASDIDKDKLSWKIENKPAWASFSTSTGQLSGTPTNASVGTYADIRISVCDGKVSA
jgi:hypothetical protein